MAENTEDNGAFMSRKHSAARIEIADVLVQAVPSEMTHKSKMDQMSVDNVERTLNYYKM